MKEAPIETDFRPVHATVRCTTTCDELHPPSTLGPASLSVVSSAAENTSPAGLCDIGICPWKWLSLLGPSDSTSLHFAFRKPWWPTRSKPPVQHPYCLRPDSRMDNLTQLATGACASRKPLFHQLPLCTLLTLTSTFVCG